MRRVTRAIVVCNIVFGWASTGTAGQATLRAPTAANVDLSSLYRAREDWIVTLRRSGRRERISVAMKHVAITALMVGLILSGCSSIGVRPVDYTFTTPLSTIPLGLRPVTDHRKDFAPVFCKAMQQYPGDRTSADCRAYLQLDASLAPPVPFPPLPPLGDKYRVIVVAGIFSACLPKEAAIFKQGLEALVKDGMKSADEIPISASGGSAPNAKIIADYIRQHRDPDRPYIAIGYSQGAVDLLQAYVDDDVVRSSIAAVITIAGAVGGSRLPDGFSPGLIKALGGLEAHLPQCTIKNLNDGINTLRRETRVNFLVDHASVLPRSYSVAAKSTYKTTSKVLQGGWKQLSAYSIDQDSQVIRDEAAVPGGAFLGTALGDHWAVALPFSEAHNPLFDAGIDHNHFPRTALIEAMVRFAINDLEITHSADWLEHRGRTARSRANRHAARP